MMGSTASREVGRPGEEFKTLDFFSPDHDESLQQSSQAVAASPEAVVSRAGASGWPFGHLRMFAYGAVHIDLPWSYRMYSKAGYAKSPETHYETMPDEEVLRLPVGDLADKDCVLWMWAVWPKLPIAMECMKRWGFEFKTGGAWHKKTKHGKTSFGTGYILRSASEPFLIGTIGNPNIGSKSVRNLIESKVREHSRKPPESREFLEKLTPGVLRCDVFARTAWKDNDVWGRESGKFEHA